jgi:hypothetical protein
MKYSSLMYNLKVNWVRKVRNEILHSWLDKNAFSPNLLVLHVSERNESSLAMLTIAREFTYKCGSIFVLDSSLAVALWSDNKKEAALENPKFWRAN